MMVGKLTPGVAVPQVMTSRQQRKFVNKSQTLPPSAVHGLFANDALQVIPERVPVVATAVKNNQIIGSTKSHYTAMAASHDNNKEASV